MQAVSKTQVKATRETEEKIISEFAVKKTSLLSNVFSHVKKALLSDITIYKADSYQNESPKIDAYPEKDFSSGTEVKKALSTASVRANPYFK